ncbi:MAG: hypothetical protein RBS39_12420 [Phycisphaerales bacterium]|jgi:hypothetical protein|nr:hypothetical protein [Phycisphaerales bacterium]
MTDYYNTTIFHPAAIALLVILAIPILIASRSSAVICLIIGTASVSAAQRLVIAGLDFNFLRLLVVLLWARIAIRGEWAMPPLRALDWTIVAWILIGSALYAVQQQSMDAVVNGAGRTFDTLGLHFGIRAMVRDGRDMRRIALAIALLAVPLVVVFLIEQFTGRNFFSALGGVPQRTIVRDGRLRCQGPFPHAILAGMFWAALLPFVAVRLADRGYTRWVAALGMVCGTVIVMTTASSTPYVGLMCAFFAISLAWMRWSVRYFQIGSLVLMVVLQIAMQKPIWHLMGRLQIVSGSTGYHRYRLIDQAVRRFTEWAVIGSRSTAHWGYGLNDVTNQYVMEGLAGGVLRLGLFIAVLVLAFRAVGRTLKFAGKNQSAVLVAWAPGASLFVQAFCFISITYFGQIILVFYLPLAIAASFDATRAVVAQRADSPRRIGTQPAHA